MSFYSLEDFPELKETVASPAKIAERAHLETHQKLFLALEELLRDYAIHKPHHSNSLFAFEHWARMETVKPTPFQDHDPSFIEEDKEDDLIF